MIGIIGGSGFEELLEFKEEIKVHTPYGQTSDLVKLGEINKTKVAFIPRHGKKHSLNPSQVNYRANLYALKELGVTYILSLSAVGSLKEEFKPGDLVFVDQFIDRTTQRKGSFYEGEVVCHIPMDEPFCPKIRNLLSQKAGELNLSFHPRGTIVVIEGPRFSTKAESFLYRQWNCDLIGMTIVPEVVLARELGLCYASIATVTDYDCWKEHPVNIEMVLKTMKENKEKVERLVKEVLPLIGWPTCSCQEGIKKALL